MKSVIWGLLLLLAAYRLHAQPKPTIEITTGHSHKIEVTDKATTVIAFPFSIRDGDCGTGILQMELIPEIENVIKIKAASPYMEPTSLHIFSTDGRIYTFQVFYNSNPATHTYYLSNNSGNSTVARFTSATNEQELQQFIAKATLQKARLLRRNKKYRMYVDLEGVYLHNGIILFRFNIQNRSRLPFEANWSNLFVHDKKVTRRSSVQQLSVQPVYSDKLPTVRGKSDLDYFLAIPQMTIPDKKQLTFELQEKNGGRNITINIRNKDLFKAKTL